ncbi:MAG: hypothetical protein CFK52_00650 [Chloracidobacterium sp. CP2_5A]|nr:MAG: hypothetical protein CFK52_00650 [Chloracidobacterium sp. CP2_5A]
MQAWFSWLAAGWLLAASPPVAAAAQEAAGCATVNSQAGYHQPIGHHKFQLHWISWGEWKTLGDLTVTDRNGLLVVHGAYRDPKTGDFIEIDGLVTRVEARAFDFEGKIITRASCINGGDPGARKGALTFAVTGKRRDWRLQQMQDPGDEATDYADIFSVRGKDGPAHKS